MSELCPLRSVQGGFPRTGPQQFKVELYIFEFEGHFLSARESLLCAVLNTYCIFQVRGEVLGKNLKLIYSSLYMTLHGIGGFLEILFRTFEVRNS